MSNELRVRKPDHFVLNRRKLLQRSVAVLIAGIVPSLTITHRTSAHSSTLQGTPVTCASPDASMSVQGTPRPTQTVKMTNQLRFDPENITIKAGDTIEWVNDSNMPHSATDDPAKNPVAKSHPEYVLLPDGAEPWSSELLQPGERYLHTFDTPGEYNYFCIPHVLSGMRGSITVDC